MKTAKMVCAIALVAGVFQAARGEEPSGRKEERPTSAQIRMAVQEICPVSGRKLGSHGTPVAVKIGEEQVFLCWQGCATGRVNPAHWAAIHANFAKAQGICPVMEHKLPAAPKWTIVQGQIVYVCCPPCIEKVKADPETYLKKVEDLYLASLLPPPGTRTSSPARPKTSSSNPAGDG